jgi:hypothetical protein
MSRARIRSPMEEKRIMSRALCFFFFFLLFFEILIVAELETDDIAFTSL